MSAGPTCPKCGRVNRPGVKFCATCGAALAAAAPQQSGPVQPPASPPRPASPQVPPRPAPVAQPAAPGRFKLQPLHFAIIAAAVVGVLLCGALSFLFTSGLGLVPRSTTSGGNLPDSPTALIALATEAIPATRTPIPDTATPLKETVVVTVVVTAAPTNTPLPAVPTLAPSPLPTAMPIPATVTPPPPTQTRVPPPTQPPAPLPSLPTTVPGTELQPGESWVADGMTMTVGTTILVPPCSSEAIFEFPLTIHNLGSSDLGISLDGSAFVFTDNLDESYEMYYVDGAAPAACDKYTKLVEYRLNSLGPGQKAELSIHARGNLLRDVTAFNLLITGAGRIENARWKLPVNR